MTLKAALRHFLAFLDISDESPAVGDPILARHAKSEEKSDKTALSFTFGEIRLLAPLLLARNARNGLLTSVILGLSWLPEAASWGQPAPVPVFLGPEDPGPPPCHLRIGYPGSILSIGLASLAGSSQPG